MSERLLVARHAERFVLVGQWFGAFATAAAARPAALTFHMYSLGNGPKLEPAKLEESFLSPAALDKSRQGVDALVRALAPPTEAEAAGAPPPPLWGGETAAANNGGQTGLTDTFVDSFW